MAGVLQVRFPVENRDGIGLTERTEPQLRARRPGELLCFVVVMRWSQSDVPRSQSVSAAADLERSVLDLGVPTDLRLSFDFYQYFESEIQVTCIGRQAQTGCSLDGFYPQADVLAGKQRRYSDSFESHPDGGDRRNRYDRFAQGRHEDVSYRGFIPLTESMPI